MSFERGQKVKHKLSGQDMMIVDTGLISVRLVTESDMSMGKGTIETAIISEFEVEEAEESQGTSST